MDKVDLRGWDLIGTVGVDSGQILQGCDVALMDREQFAAEAFDMFGEVFVRWLGQCELPRKSLDRELPRRRDAHDDPGSRI